MAAMPIGEDTLYDRWFMSGRNRWLVYGTLFFLAILVRLACYTGIVGSDDLAYSYYGQLLAEGTYRPDARHLALRTGLTVPLGIIYWIFGVSEWTTILVPLLLSASSVPLLVAVGHRLLPVRAALVAGFLLLTFPVHVRYATVLAPEPIMEFLVLLGVLGYLNDPKGERPTQGFLAGICFGAAYLVKEAGVFVGAALILHSLWLRRWKQAGAIAAGLALVGASEMIYYFVQTSDLLYRPHVIAHSQDRYIATHGGPGPIAYRIFKEYPREMMVPGPNFGIHSLAALIFGAVGLFLMPAPARAMMFLWAAVPMIYMNFGSSSLTHYVPVASAPRYIGLVYPPLFLFAGSVFHRWSSRGPWFRSMCWSIVFLVAAMGFACAFSTRGKGYRTDQIAALRAIGRIAEGNHLQIVRFEGDNAKIWRYSMDILSGKRLKIGDCTDRCLVIRPDAIGLPVTVQVPAARPEQSAGSWPSYPLHP